MRGCVWLRPLGVVDAEVRLCLPIYADGALCPLLSIRRASVSPQMPQQRTGTLLLPASAATSGRALGCVAASSGCRIDIPSDADCRGAQHSAAKRMQCASTMPD